MKTIRPDVRTVGSLVFIDLYKDSDLIVSMALTQTTALTLANKLTDAVENSLKKQDEPS